MSTCGEVPREDYSDFVPSSLLYAQPCKPIMIGHFNSLFIPIIYSIVLLLGVFGNGMLIFIIARYKHSRTLMDTFIFHLAVADFLLVLTLPFWMTEAISGWVFGSAMCKITGGIFALNLYSSILFLVCISFDRYMAIIHAIHIHRKRKPMYIHSACLIVWASCVLLAVIDLIFRDVYEPSYLDLKACTYLFGAENAESWKLALRLVHHCLGFFLPVAAMLYCYCMIFRTLWHTSIFKRQKSLKVIVAIVVVFVACWLPYNAVLFVDTLQSLGAIETHCAMLNILDISRTITQSLGLVHSCLNPLLYAFIGVKFRREMLSVLADIGSLKVPRLISRQSSREGGTSSEL
ncbi:C-X-C chemokine receptor type 3-2-like [Carcharodon carcharias]|uniref:C-X-C chemokine receptor type 3-2-like n=1 Tax=Carcharodon carcharias TaxID=13397 RepID=UPI001B7E6C30|nr:C-X-C chemokine receptor type 3-2-like [Carcharodon carcharias]